MLAKTAKEIDVFLVETDTLWMLDLPGTCEEIDPEMTEQQREEEDQKRRKEKEERENQKIVSR